MRVLLVQDIKAPDSGKNLQRGTAHHFDKAFSESLIKDKKAIQVKEGPLSQQWIDKVLGTTAKK